MSHPPGLVFPQVSLCVSSCRTFISSSRSAFAPYSSSSSSQPVCGEPLGPFPSPAFSSSGLLDFLPFGPLGSCYHGDASYRKNATRDATATLKAWLHEHRKNPYPTKGEKIMLAIVTKMTLTQVSTWFANARRRLKKENKMSWNPRNRSEDEEDDIIDPEKTDEMKGEAASGLKVSELIFRDMNFKDSVDTSPAPPLSTGAPPLSTGASVSDGGAIAVPKPKLWSLAEIATSSDRNRYPGPPGPPEPPGPLEPGQPQAPPPTSTPTTPFLPRHLYYPPGFIPGYSGFRTPTGPPSETHGLHHQRLQT